MFEDYSLPIVVLLYTGPIVNAKLANIGICSNNSMYACLFPITESDFDVRITSITVSLLVFAILTFVIGFLLGALLVKYIMKSSKEDKVMSVPVPGSVPLYEEIT